MTIYFNIKAEEIEHLLLNFNALFKLQLKTTITDVIKYQLLLLNINRIFISQYTNDVENVPKIRK